MRSSFETNTTTAERAIVRRLLREGLASGYAVTVSDGENCPVRNSRDERGILACLATTDHDVMTFAKLDNRVASFVLIWGNDEDVISDYTDNTEAARLAAVAQQAVSL